jgi:hypothetical protein
MFRANYRAASCSCPTCLTATSETLVYAAEDFPNLALSGSSGDGIGQRLVRPDLGLSVDAFVERLLEALVDSEFDIREQHSSA